MWGRALRWEPTSRRWKLRLMPSTPPSVFSRAETFSMICVRVQRIVHWPSVKGGSGRDFARDEGSNPHGGFPTGGQALAPCPSWPRRPSSATRSTNYASSNSFRVESAGAARTDNRELEYAGQYLRRGAGVAPSGGSNPGG
jgi:hypothetical protein